MYLRHLTLTNYKNIAATSLDFSSKLNCVIGSNGMGKTNLLDSIFYLSFTKTHTNLPDQMVIKEGQEMAVLEGDYCMNSKDEKLFIGIRNGKPKVLKRNKKEYPRLSDHIGIFPLVMISPSDIELIKGGSIERRKFMDQLISQESNDYLVSAINYKRLLEQRNTLLKQPYGLDFDVLSILDEQMAREAEVLHRYRVDWVTRIRPLFLKNYHFISDNRDSVDLRFLPSFESEEPYDAALFLRMWKESFEKDRLLGHTSLGPHKDDLEMLLNGTLIRKVGSQGQNKSYMVALKFAQYVLLSSRMNAENRPIILLDDVFDKLDAHRVDRIVQLVAGSDFGQIFMTDTNRKYLDHILSELPEPNYSIIEATEGNFRILEAVGDETH